MSSRDLAVGIDFGGTKMLGVLVDRSGSRLAEHRLPTPYEPEELLDGLVEIVAELEGRAPGGLAGLGVGAAGLVTPDGVLRFGPNVGGVVDVDIPAGIQQRRPGLSVVVENDATCATWSESVVGAGRGVAELALVTLGTGIGGGLIVDRKLATGNNHFSGEFGHMTIQVDGEPCVCGRRGCWEAYASGRALGRLGRQYVAAGRAHEVLKAAGSVDAVRGEHVTAVARTGDVAAAEIMAEFARWVAVGIANIIAICDPEAVVVGGGLADDADLFLAETQRAVADLVFGAANRPDVPLMKAALGPHAGAIGAALLVFEGRPVT